MMSTHGTPPFQRRIAAAVKVIKVPGAEARKLDRE